MSDSHGSKAELQKLVEKHGDEVDLMIHCGDSELSIDDPIIEKFQTVRGNCDVDRRFPEELVTSVEGYRVYATHGHLYSVKTSLMSLKYRGVEKQANIVCFGHSHVLGMELIDGMLFVNPGSIRLPRRRVERTYVILEIHSGKVTAKVYDDDQGELSELESSFLLSKSL
ncbi:metallophosphoesterase [Cytobacillus spongiae]|uniref:metallophosphoesterase family protein n=1 Tax=Cytobacillus spongiae TaxID=2901381 RepID=UPI001F293248|nr:metallophosphoesterase [Cytobacillus spongiae]UII55088.1 metallophosphoesterase [Cytobacillus spongiae]